MVKKIDELEENQNSLKNKTENLIAINASLSENTTKISNNTEKYQLELKFIEQLIIRQKADLEYIEKENDIFIKKLNDISSITNEKKCSTSKLTHILWNISGTSKEVLINCPESEQKRYLGIGIALLVPTILAFLSGLGLLQDSLRDRPIILAILALLWALIIFLIDLALVVSYRKQANVMKGLIQILPRIFLSVVIAISVVHPAMLYINSRDIKTHTNTMLDNEFKAECSNYNHAQDKTALIPANNCGVTINDIPTLNQQIAITNKEITDWENFAEQERISTIKKQLKPPYKSILDSRPYTIKISGKPSKDDKKAPNESFYLTQAKKVEEINTKLKAQFNCINVFQTESSKAKSEQIRCQSIKETIDDLKHYPTSSLLEQTLLNMIFYKSNPSLNYFANKNIKQSELDIDYTKLTKYISLALVLFFIDILAVMIKINSNGLYEQKVIYNESLNKIKFLIQEHMNFIVFFFREKFNLTKNMNKEQIVQEMQNKVNTQNEKIIANFLEKNTNNIINSKSL